MKIEAKPTKYKEQYFDSRLEARWAVFFDLIGVEWLYRKKGFNLVGEPPYKPDFLLPKYPLLVEIRGKKFYGDGFLSYDLFHQYTCPVAVFDGYLRDYHVGALFIDYDEDDKMGKLMNVSKDGVPCCWGYCVTCQTPVIGSSPDSYWRKEYPCKCGKTPLEHWMDALSKPEFIGKAYRQARNFNFD